MSGSTPTWPSGSCSRCSRTHADTERPASASRSGVRARTSSTQSKTTAKASQTTSGIGSSIPASAATQRVSLPFNQPVGVPVHIAPRTPGVHSAALEVVEASGLVVHQVLATISGKMRKRFVRLTAGDRVKMEMSPYDLNKARIVWRIG